MAGKLTKLKKVNESFTINRYDNGWMVEVSGRDENDDWKIHKILCNTEDELLGIVKEYNTMTVDN